MVDVKDFKLDPDPVLKTLQDINFNPVVDMGVRVREQDIKSYILNVKHRRHDYLKGNKTKVSTQVSCSLEPHLPKKKDRIDSQKSDEDPWDVTLAELRERILQSSPVVIPKTRGHKNFSRPPPQVERSIAVSEERVLAVMPAISLVKSNRSRTKTSKKPIKEVTPNQTCTLLPGDENNQELEECCENTIKNPVSSPTVDLLDNAIDTDESQDINNTNLYKNLSPGLTDLVLNQNMSSIRRPPNAFVLFAKDHRRNITVMDPKLSKSKLLGSMWQNLNESEKAKYFANATALKNLHKETFPEYVYSPNEAMKRKKIINDLKLDIEKVMKNEPAQNNSVKVKNVSVGSNEPDIKNVELNIKPKRLNLGLKKISEAQGECWKIKSHSQSSITKSNVKKVSSAPTVRRQILQSSKSLLSSNKVDKNILQDDPKGIKNYAWPNLVSERKSLMKNYGSGASEAEEEMIFKSFEDVPRITLYSTKELETELMIIEDCLNTSNDWENRVEMSIRLRSLIIAGGHEYDEFYAHLRLLELPFQTSVKDVRSQVVREACTTIAYLSQHLGSKLDHFAESLLPCLISLIPNKNMSTAGIVAIRFIIRYTHVSRLIPIITSHVSSKSKDIRKACFKFLDQLLVTWPTQLMEEHLTALTDAVRKGMSDPDPETRVFSRKAFWSFADHFREQADYLLSLLDNNIPRMLHDEPAMSTLSNSDSLAHGSRPYTSSNHAGSAENMSFGHNSTLGCCTGISNLLPSKQDSCCNQRCVVHNHSDSTSRENFPICSSYQKSFPGFWKPFSQQSHPFYDDFHPALRNPWMMWPDCYLPVTEPDCHKNLMKFGPLDHFKEL